MNANDRRMLQRVEHAAERGGAIAACILAWLFRLFVLVLFLPMVFGYVATGQWWKAGAVLAFALVLGAMMAPTD
jgi:small-conductance mechanosensitive channel